ncbi:MAG: hypothetical protein ACFCUI_06490 [Bernardetiaceae bacterium]
MTDTHQITIFDHNGDAHQIEAQTGDNLRRLLLQHGFSPYAPLTQRLNCGGRGLCATCGVWIHAPELLPPTHWHDRLAHRFGYSRLSCQISVNQDITLQLDAQKKIWGSPRK